MKSHPDLTKATAIGVGVTSARRRLNSVMAAARAVALETINNGASEVAVAKAIGVDRNTIRRWQGK